MKSRFLKALTHELPGSEFPLAATLSRAAHWRIRGTVRSFTPAQPPMPKLLADESPRGSHGAHTWWRFASAWRKNEIEFIPEGSRPRLFHCLVTTMAVLTLLVAAGCKSAKPETQYSDLNSAMSPAPASVEMPTATNSLDPALLRAPTNLFTLGPGDKLDIELADETNSLESTVVGPDGKIYFNLLPGLDVWGLTLGQTRDLLEHEMSKYIRGRPQVNLILREVQSKRVWLLGRFQAPGVYGLTNATTVLEAVSEAGGAQSFAGQRQISQGGPLGEDLADLRHSFIVRHGKMLPVDFEALLDKGDLSQNIYLQPDDFIYFAPAYAKEVYVLGAVTQPQPVQYVRHMTVIQAIAGAYGTVRNAWLAQTTIVRGSLAQPKIDVVNYYDIVKGKAPDIALQPNDIVYVPFTPYRYLRDLMDAALNTFASAAAVNAGTRASAPAAGGASGVVIPVGSGITIIPPPAPPVGGP